MSKEKKQPFEVPKLIALDGKELTEDNLLSEFFGDNCCGSGGGTNNGCTSGTGRSSTVLVPCEAGLDGTDQ